MKRTWCALAGLLLLTVTTAQAQFDYITNAGGDITITGYYGYDTEVTIPAAIDGLPVTVIGNDAFEYQDLASVTLPSTILSIGDAAFYYNSILTNVTMEMGVNSIGESAFSDCFVLTSVTVPASVTNFGDYAFAGCYNLTNATIQNGVAGVGNYAFSGCSGLISITMPDSINSIGDDAFDDCTALTNIVMDSALASIGAAAFQNCTGVTGFLIPGSVTNIGSNAFSLCTSLMSINVDPQNSFYASVDGVLFDKSQSLLMVYPGGLNGSYAIPSSATDIAQNAFYGCAGLAGVTIPASITNIEANAFYGCASLAAVAVPGSVSTVGEDAFAFCDDLASVTLAAGITHLGDGAFSGCTNLASVMIPGSVLDLGSYAFSGCTSLAAFIIPNSVTNLGEYVFSDCTGLASVMIPGSVGSVPQGAFNGCYSLAGVTMENGLTCIGDGAFYGCVSLGSVTIPGSVTSITYDAFYACDGLTNATFAEGFSSITNAVFLGCPNLASVAIPASLTNIANDALGACGGLRAITVAAQNPVYSSVNGVLFDKSRTTLLEYPAGLSGSYTIPGNVTTIGEASFQYCGGLVSVTIPDSVTNIGDNAFNDCSSLASVTIPNSVTSLGDGAFQNCPSLGSVTIPGSVADIGDYAFYECTGLTNVVLDNGIGNIGDDAFFQCGLTDVTIPASVTNLGQFAFSDSFGLASILFQGRPPTADSTVFLNDSATVYYQPHSAGWSSTFEGLPTTPYVTSVIKVETFPAGNGNSVTGGGAYINGVSATLNVFLTNACEEFIGWTVGGKIVSIYDPYTFTVTKNETIVAQFAVPEFTLSASSSPPYGGSVSGGGKKPCGTSTRLTARARAGFAFAGWTSPDFPGFSDTNATLTGEITGDVSFVAQFNDVQPPSIKITSPTVHEQVRTAPFVIEGTAKDNVGVAAVYYDLNNSGWTNASTTNHFASWSAGVTLTPNSTNILYASAVDASGNFSATNGPIEFVCTAEGLAPLSIAGLQSEMTSATNEDSPIQLSFDSAAYVKMALNAYDGGEVGIYTYTPTGPNSAELELSRVLPTPGYAVDGPALALTFTDAYTAAFTNLSGDTGTFSFGPSGQRVPQTLDGVTAIFTSFASGVDGNYMATNFFDSGTFTTGDSLGGSYSGSYTLTPFTSLAALLVQAYANPVAMAGITNYVVLTYHDAASPVAGFYCSDNLGAAGEISSDFGSFYQFTSNKASDAKFVGPATLDGLQASVTPKNGPSFTRSFGKGTFASLSSTNTEPVDAGLILANIRVSATTGKATFLALDPPYAVGADNDTIDLNWASSARATAGQAATLNFSAAPNYAPTALSGRTITANKTNIFTFTNNLFSGSSGALGTYTYAPYTPTMALIKTTSTNSSLAGAVEYLILNYQSVTKGDCVMATANLESPGEWIFNKGVFEMN